MRRRAPDRSVTKSNAHGPDASAPPAPGRALASDGWVVLAGAFPLDLISSVRSQFPASLARRDRIRHENGVEQDNDGTLHHLLCDHPVYLDLLAAFEQFDSLIKEFFTGNYILNSYGGVVNRRDARAYVHNVHRDIRFASEEKRFMLNSLVMLDEFTDQNGGTRLLTASHLETGRPDPERFLREAACATGPVGSVLFFDSRLWHAAGQNYTDSTRRALTLTFTSPFFKQQFDYPRAIGYENRSTLSPYLQQVIGFNARTPSTLNEYYVRPAARFYLRGQDEDV